MDRDDTIIRKLFPTTVANANLKDRDYRLSDGKGLYLLVKSNGRKLWRLDYRYPGKQRTLSFGAWPEVGLGRTRLASAAMSRTGW